jgi:protein-L-isoaspartate(D-aspartate) O-methyltransferase
MTVDASRASSLTTSGPLSPIAAWLADFDRAGRHLAGHAALGILERGLRAVLTHHVIFHWNRLGLRYADQRVLSELAADVVMAGEHSPEPPGDAGARGPG